MWGPALPSLSIPPSCYRTRAEQRKAQTARRTRATKCNNTCTPLDGGSGGGGGGPDIKSSWLNCYIAVIGRDDDIHGHISIGHPILVHTSPTRDRSPMLKLSSLQPRRDETSHPCFALGVGVLYGVRMMGTYILSMRSSRMHSLLCHLHFGPSCDSRDLGECQ
jgi:hypothetical protein